MTEIPSITDGLEALRRRFGVGGDPGPEPVFLLAAGWRSGSTLVQRLLASSGELLMWGEPYDHCGLIRSLAEGVRPFAEAWPPGSVFVTTKVSLSILLAALPGMALVEA